MLITGHIRFIIAKYTYSSTDSADKCTFTLWAGAVLCLNTTRLGYAKNRLISEISIGALNALKIIQMQHDAAFQIMLLSWCL